MPNRTLQCEEERAQINADRRDRYARNRNSPNRSLDRQPPRNRPVRAGVRVLQQTLLAAFNYDSAIDYSAYGCIGGMTVRCAHCGATKFPNKTDGMSCANGKVKLPTFNSPPDPLRSLIFGMVSTSTHFLSHIQEYNASFQMTSFGATKIIQGQIYHRAGSLLPYPDSDHQFLQIYFVGNENRELDRRCTIASRVRRQIVSELQTFFHQHNELVQVFKIALDRMPSDNHKIIIKADRTPIGEHASRFNAPKTDDVAIVIVGTSFNLATSCYIEEMSNYSVFQSFTAAMMHYNIHYCTGKVMTPRISIYQ
ncbi:uncharacterized protein LOC122625608 isoform X2 [Drosophila teissieri]|uniref:uncharacterized protein LOC122625608 isoform X2 n=1 Tax=Drosophila teissieri TaxID=7243 RepID=UPI001CB9DB16|nr:uncharacterized protein LOC122625608 isoform X2 [Drosophila teissieri]